MNQNKSWGTLPDGRTADLIKLVSPGGAVAEISNYGGIIRSLTVPLPGGETRQTVLGFETPGEYAEDTASIGVTVGPYANRIRGGKFTLGGKTYLLEQNEGGNTLHSGSCGWQKKLFDYDREGNALSLRLRRPDGEGGFPGNLDVTVTFAWRDDMTLVLSYLAETDMDTVVSMTHHSYFNLGRGALAHDHRLRLRADAYTPVDGEGLPTGQIISVAGTPFDFTRLRPIAQGYDNNFVLTPGDGPAATLQSPDGKLSMDVFTDMPGLQLYTGIFLNKPFTPSGAVCLETQHFPDAPNIPLFPSPVIGPKMPYHSTTAFAFRSE